MNACEHCGQHKAKKRFCNRSCSNAWQHANGIRRTYVNDKTTWDWWVEKYGIEEAIRRKESQRQATSKATSGENNPMFGRHDHVHGLYRIHEFRRGKTFEELYGEERAAKIKHRQSLMLSGENNPAYGKVYSRGGRSKIMGVYRGFRFKSSYELSWLVDVLTQGIHVTIPKLVKYTIDGRQRTYLPDFQIGNVVIEIKPSMLLTHPSNVPKFEAAREFCTLNGLEYKILTEFDLKLLSIEQITTLTNVEWNNGSKEYLDEKMQNRLCRRGRSDG